jgi:hypothetical protein
MDCCLGEDCQLEAGYDHCVAQKTGAVDGINNVYSTIGYIKAFGECKAESKDAAGLYQKMLARYPQRINPIILWIGCQANFPEGQ